jgi:hypothetical protein
VNAPKNGHYGILAKAFKMKVLHPDMKPVGDNEAKSSSSVLT